MSKSPPKQNSKYTPSDVLAYKPNNFTNPIIKQQLSKDELLEKDERYKYLVKNGKVVLSEHGDHSVMVILPQIPQTYIYYRSNQLRAFEPELLNLADKQLQHVPLIEGEEQAKELILSRNEIYDLENLVSLPEIHKLDISHNLVHKLAGLDQLPLLDTLMANNNFIESVDRLDYLSKLVHLDLSYNKLKSLKNIDSLVALKYLDASNNDIEQLGIKRQMPSLKTLILKKNKIRNVKGIGHMTNLLEVDITGNLVAKIEDLYDLEGLKDLKNLDVDIFEAGIEDQIYELLSTLTRLNGKPIKASTSEANVCVDKFDKDVSRRLVGNTPTSKLHNKQDIEADFDKLIKEPKPLHQVQSIEEIKKKFEEKCLELNQEGFRQKSDIKLGDATTLYGFVAKINQYHVKVVGDAYKEFFTSQFNKYQSIEELTLEYVLIDNLALKENRMALEQLPNLKTLNLSSNNITQYLELINFENIETLAELNIKNNPVCDCDLVKYFVFYRFSSIKAFNGQAKTDKELKKTKSMYLEFDKLLQKLNKTSFRKHKLSADKQKISKKIAESYITSLQNQNFIEKNIDSVYETLVKDYVTEISQL